MPDFEGFFGKHTGPLPGLSVYQCGHEKCESRHSFGPAARDHYLIHYVVSGFGEFHAGGRVYRLSRGSGFLITPYRSTFYIADTLAPWEYYWIGFNGSEAESLLNLCGLSEQEPVFQYRLAEPLESHLQAAVTASGLSSAQEYALLGQLYLFLSCLMRSNPAVQDKPSDYRAHLKNAVRYISDHYFDDITVEKLASFVGVSRSHLYRVFMSELHMSVQQYLLKFRLEKACFLACNTALSLGEIAASCGFSDQSYFSRSFRRAYGEPPLTYRRTQDARAMLPIKPAGPSQAPDKSTGSCCF